MMIILKDGPLTLTYQVTEAIKELIAKNYKPGDLIPTEKEFVKEFDVSTITVRNALDTLVHEGLIYRRRGKGTFVAEKKVSSESYKLTSATELFRNAGWKSEVRILSLVLEDAGDYHSRVLRCKENDSVFRLARLRALDGEPYSEEINFLPASIFPDFDKVYTGGSLYACMEKTYGVIPACSEEIYKAILLDSSSAKNLGCNRGDAALFLTGKVFDGSGRIIGYEESVYRADKFELKVSASANGLKGKRLIGEKEV